MSHCRLIPSITFLFPLSLFCLAMAEGVHADHPEEDGANRHATKNEKVLRHAVFFSFMPSSSDADVRSVVDAFEALLEKVDSIIGFQHGVNDSPEKLDDGFTHAFLLSFDDEAGRTAYLPHPAHQEFGNVLRPHMKDVFVIDYWGDASQPTNEGELRHAVFFKFKDNAEAEQVEAVEQAFAALPAKIDAIKAFEWGKNNSPEKHDDGFTHCFMVTFRNGADRETYLPHPEHKAFVKLLRPVLDKVRVIDFVDQP